jgi:hypothetical protein
MSGRSKDLLRTPALSLTSTTDCSVSTQFITLCHQDLGELAIGRTRMTATNSPVTRMINGKAGLQEENEGVYAPISNNHPQLNIHEQWNISAESKPSAGLGSWRWGSRERASSACCRVGSSSPLTFTNLIVLEGVGLRLERLALQVDSVSFPGEATPLGATK